MQEIREWIQKIETTDLTHLVDDNSMTHSIQALLNNAADEESKEAHDLLYDWVESSTVFLPLSLKDLDDEIPTFSYTAQRPTASIKKLSSIQSLINNAMDPISSGITPPKDLRLSQQARHQLVKERKDYLDMQKRLLQEQKLRDKQEKRLETKWNKTTERLQSNRFKVQSEVDVLNELKKDMEDKARKQREEYDAQIKTLKEKMEKERKEREKQARLEKEEVIKKEKEEMVVMRIVEQQEMRRMRQLQKTFAGWSSILRKQKALLGQMQVKGNWKTKRKFWMNWKEKKSVAGNARMEKEIAEKLHRENSKLVKVERRYRMRIQSIAFLAWFQWHTELKEEKLLLMKHMERKQKIQNFLSNLEFDESTTSVYEDTTPTPAKHESNRAPKPLGKPSLVANRDINSLVKQVDQLCVSSKQEKEQERMHMKKKTDNADRKFLETFQLREKKRMERKQKAEMRRKEKEEREKLRLKEEECQRREEAEKRKSEAVEKRKNAIRLAALEEERKKQEEELRRNQLVMSKNVHQKSIIKYYGLIPWRRRLNKLNDQNSIAISRFNANQARQPFTIWLEKFNVKQTCRETQATEKHDSVLMCMMFSKMLKCIRADYDIESFAWQHYQKVMKMQTFWKFNQSFLQHRLIRNENEKKFMERVQPHIQKNLKKRFINAWSDHTKSSKEERWKDYQRKQLKDKVKLWLSDSLLEKDD